jgi:hypothetical protein
LALIVFLKNFTKKNYDDRLVAFYIKLNYMESMDQPPTGSQRERLADLSLEELRAHLADRVGIHKRVRSGEVPDVFPVRALRAAIRKKIANFSKERRGIESRDARPKKLPKGAPPEQRRAFFEGMSEGTKLRFVGTDECRNPLDVTFNYGGTSMLFYYDGICRQKGRHKLFAKFGSFELVGGKA